MFRVHGHVLADNKSIWISLTTVYGIGRERSQKILEKVAVPYLTKVKDITDDQQKAIVDELKNYILENDLRREV